MEVRLIGFANKTCGVQIDFTLREQATLRVALNDRFPKPRGGVVDELLVALEKCVPPVTGEDS